MKNTNPEKEISEDSILNDSESLSLGIDAGGTYTDAAVVNMKTRQILQSEKSLTTYPDPLGGIQNVLNTLDAGLLKKVRLLSVSTTFATNTILEKNGAPVSLILIGTQKISEHLKDLCVVVKGGHNYRGKENEELDEEAIREHVLAVRDKVSAFAVSAFYSILNPDHEQRARQIIQELTSYPVVCGHELAQSLGAYERGITAYLNASLLPVAQTFLNSVLAETKNRAMSVKTTMLKCNGAVALIKEVMERPVETIFSGPAASVLGASFLSKKTTCLAIDVGGTSTDVSMIRDGIPQISDLGATVGGWKTKVRAIRMETTAAGGDSHIWADAPTILDARLPSVTIGPRRVIPLCRAALMYPDLINTIQNNFMPFNQFLNEFVQKTTLVLKSGHDPSQFQLSSDERRAYDKIPDTPAFLSDLPWEKEYIPFEMIENLVNKRLIQLVGFTPTDVLHITGDFRQWNTEASRIGAKKLCEIFKMTEEDFCRFVKRKFAQRMALEVVYFLNDSYSRDELNAFMNKSSDASFLRFKVDIPVILIGAPVNCFISELREFIDAEIITPEHYAVGNAVGCLEGKLAKRVELRIDVDSLQEENGDWVTKFTTYTTDGQKTFPNKESAVHYAGLFGKRDIYKYMTENGINQDDVEIRVRTKEIGVDPIKPPVQIDIAIEGFAENKIE